MKKRRMIIELEYDDSFGDIDDPVEREIVFTDLVLHW